MNAYTVDLRFAAVSGKLAAEAADEILAELHAEQPSKRRSKSSSGTDALSRRTHHPQWQVKHHNCPYKEGVSHACV